MALFKKALLSAVTLFLVVFTGTGYKYAANCVSGTIVKELKQTQGRIGLYVMALQTLMPIYGNLVLMAQGPAPQCGTAANAINLNLLNEPMDVFKHFKNMTQIGALQSLQKGNIHKGYLYVFRSKGYAEYNWIADCVPGPIVKGLDQTGGRIALYTMALTTILPGLFGDLVYLGEGNNSACVDMMNSINEGNSSVVSISKVKNNMGMKQIGVLQGLKVADNHKSYIYVFKNKMWNTTNNIMIPGLKEYGLPADFVMVEHKNGTDHTDTAGGPAHVV
eukprot:TRINITY_DN757_c0_g1_i4.p1 TRINITY_DN757_c0_g1~~TRINITY_DN757_c0_g1_i4.p1  ORF type:complete len:276 (+),score=43.72 TRINITY_DN757_c0_g1_i4:58-885(+)